MCITQGHRQSHPRSKATSEHVRIAQGPVIPNRLACPPDVNRNCSDDEHDRATDHVAVNKPKMAHVLRLGFPGEDGPGKVPPRPCSSSKGSKKHQVRPLTIRRKSYVLD